jgi:hypothetical protein
MLAQPTTQVCLVRGEVERPDVVLRVCDEEKIAQGRFEAA